MWTSQLDKSQWARYSFIMLIHVAYFILSGIHLLQEPCQVRGKSSILVEKYHLRRFKIDAGRHQMIDFVQIYINVLFPFSEQTQEL